MRRAAMNNETAKDEQEDINFGPDEEGATPFVIFGWVHQRYPRFETLELDESIGERIAEHIYDDLLEQKLTKQSVVCVSVSSDLFSPRAGIHQLLRDALGERHDKAIIDSAIDAMLKSLDLRL
jgi:hypothetical protein